jgi:hypothetical protein
LDIGPDSGFFSQPGDGHLHYSDGGYKNDRLSSANPVRGAFFVSMRYSNFIASNNTEPGWILSSCVELKLQAGDRAVFIAGYQKNSEQGFGAAYSIPGDKNLLCNVVVQGINSGWLGMGYNGISGAGGEATFWYDTGAGWTKLATYAPNFSGDPSFMVQGYDLYGQSLSFQVDQVLVFPPGTAGAALSPLLLD